MNAFSKLKARIRNAIQNKKEFIKNSTLAMQGHASAQQKLGSAYLFGRGVAENPKEAVKWLRLAKEQGDAAAISQLVIAYRNVGSYYMFGKGGSIDLKEAEKWLRLAADQGDYIAKSLLEDLHKILQPLFTAAKQNGPVTLRR